MDALEIDNMVDTHGAAPRRGADSNALRRGWAGREVPRPDAHRTLDPAEPAAEEVDERKTNPRLCSEAKFVTYAVEDGVACGCTCGARSACGHPGKHATYLSSPARVRRQPDVRGPAPRLKTVLHAWTLGRTGRLQLGPYNSGSTVQMSLAL